MTRRRPSPLAAIAPLLLLCTLAVPAADAEVDERGTRQNLTGGQPFVVPFTVPAADVADEPLSIRIQVGVHGGEDVNVYVLDEAGKQAYDAGGDFDTVHGARWFEVRDVNHDITVSDAGQYFLVIDIEDTDGTPRGGATIFSYVVFGTPPDRGLPGPTILLVIAGLLGTSLATRRATR